MMKKVTVTVLLNLLSIAAVVQGFALGKATNAGNRVPNSRLAASTATSPIKTKDQIAQELLAYSRKVGPVGSLATEEERQQVAELAKKLSKVRGNPRPSKEPLRGIHNLVYSAAPGGSSGRLFGSFYGKVTQEFLDDNHTFVNAVRVGPLEISLQAERIVKNDKTNVVKFRKSKVKIFGNTVVENDISGRGTWKYLFMGEVKDKKGNPRLLRVMETPSLFVIEQPLPKKQ